MLTTATDNHCRMYRAYGVGLTIEPRADERTCCTGLALATSANRTLESTAPPILRFMLCMSSTSYAVSTCMAGTSLSLDIASFRLCSFLTSCRGFTDAEIP